MQKKEERFWVWEFPIGVSLFWDPYNKDPTIYTLGVWGLGFGIWGFSCWWESRQPPMSRMSPVLAKVQFSFQPEPVNPEP